MGPGGEATLLDEQASGMMRSSSKTYRSSSQQLEITPEGVPKEIDVEMLPPQQTQQEQQAQQELDEAASGMMRKKKAEVGSAASLMELLASKSDQEEIEEAIQSLLMAENTEKNPSTKVRKLAALVMDLVRDKEIQDAIVAKIKEIRGKKVKGDEAFIFTPLGEHQCPKGYDKIKDAKACEKGAKFLGHQFLDTDDKSFKGGKGAVCTARHCTKSNPHCPVGMSKKYASQAKWVCAKKVDKKYYVSAKGEKCEVPIERKKHCKAAAERLAVKWGGQHSDEDKCFGCLVKKGESGETHFHFNSLQDGKCDKKERVQVCRRKDKNPGKKFKMGKKGFQCTAGYKRVRDEAVCRKGAYALDKVFYNTTQQNFSHSFCTYFGCKEEDCPDGINKIVGMSIAYNRKTKLVCMKNSKARVVKFGDKGKNKCPDGFEQITDEGECEEGAAVLGKEYIEAGGSKSKHSELFGGGDNAVCVGRGCAKNEDGKEQLCPVGMSAKHGNNSKFLCKAIYAKIGEKCTDSLEQKKLSHVTTTSTCDIGLACAGFEPNKQEGKCEVAKFVFGDMGVDGCPSGFEHTTDENICKKGAAYLDKKYISGTIEDAKPGNISSIHLSWFKGGKDSICVGRSCNGNNSCPVGMSAAHGGHARFVCVMKCDDDPDYRDQRNSTCEDWKNDDCNKAVQDWKFPASAQAELLAKCPKSCKVSACIKAVNDTPTTQVTWILGSPGETCTAVCGSSGWLCDSVAQGTLTSNEALGKAFEKAGHKCKKFNAASSSAGTPFARRLRISGALETTDCTPLKKHSNSSCSHNSNPDHSALCACTQQAPEACPNMGILDPAPDKRSPSFCKDEPAGLPKDEKSWCAPNLDFRKNRTLVEKDYPSLDLGTAQIVHGVVVQGRKNLDQWVKKYSVQYSLDGPEGKTRWSTIPGTYGGSHDRNTKVQSNFLKPVNARYIKIQPLEWQDWPSMRFGVVVCRGPTCSDDPAFKDEKGNKCRDWLRGNCSNAVQEHKYSADGAAMLVV